MTLNGTQETVIVNGAEVVASALSVTFTVNEDVPTPVGVPLMTPPALRDKPAGKDPLPNAHVYGAVPPCAVSVT